MLSAGVPGPAPEDELLELDEPVRAALGKALADTVKDPGTRAELEKIGVEVAYEPGSAYDTRVARELPLPTITGLILGEIGRLVKEPPDRKKQCKIPLFTTIHRKHLMIEE